MKKNMFMRLAMALVLLVLVTTSAVGGTYAKYVTSDTSTVSARVAKWGFEANENSIKIDDLFAKAYTNADSQETVKSSVSPGCVTMLHTYMIFPLLRAIASKISSQIRFGIILVNKLPMLRMIRSAFSIAFTASFVATGSSL